MTDGVAGIPGQSVLASPLVHAGRAGVQMQLARRDGNDGGASPFVVLHQGRFARVYLAEIVVDGAAVVARFAWKVRGDEEAGRRAAGRVLTNGQVDAMWAQERASLARVQDAHVVAAFAAPAAMTSSLPVFHCRRTDRFFHPVSPSTGLPLRVCRDDELLTANGLPPYAQDVARYLHDGTRGAVTFYRERSPRADERLPTTAPVRSGAQWIADLLPLVHADANDAAAIAAADALPCVRCQHREQCFPRDAAAGALPASHELHAVSFYDVDAISLALHDFDYDEACVLLGGADVQDVVAARAVAGTAAGIAMAAATALAADRQWLFAHDPSLRLLEVLRQKLSLFLGVCAGVGAVHATGRPHLGLAPCNVLVSWQGSRGAPARWQLHAAVNDLGSAMLVDLAPSGAMTDGALGMLFEPGFDVRADAKSQSYLTPTGLGSETSTITLPVACWQTGSQDDLVRFVVEAQGAGVPRAFGAGDLVVVQPTSGGASLVARIDEVRPRGLLASALLKPSDPCAQWDGQPFEARLTFHRRLGPAADLHALGMLLLRTLLVNDEQSIEDVAASMAKCLRRLGDEPTGVRMEARPAAERLQQLLAARDMRGRFEPLQLLHRASDRAQHQQAVAAAVPQIDPAIWSGVLVAVGKLLATWSPFAYAESAAASASLPLQALVGDLQALVRRLDVELFHARARDAAIAVTGADVRTQLLAQLANTAAAGGAPAAPTPGFRLLVQRDGDTTQQDLVYQVQRVTIGRREGENLLRLNDPMVSSAHAFIEWSEEGWTIQDCNSTNGTEVDGIRLPGEVAQPLQPGSVVVIRPFRMTFQPLAVGADEPAAPAAASVAELLVQLRSAFAAHVGEPDLEVHAALLEVLRAARDELSPAALLASLQALEPASSSAANMGDGAADSVPAVAARALAQLSRSLLGPQELATGEQVQQFVGKLGRFVESTLQWLERMLEMKRTLGKQLDLGIASTGAGRPAVRTPAELRALVLGWSEDTPAADASAWFLGKFYDDVVAIVLGLLRANLQTRRSVRERLDPVRLVEAASREAKLRLLVQASASSALWKMYVQAFLEVTAGAEPDAQLEQLLQRAQQERAARL